jgi:NADPH:quinone reductase
MMNAWQVTKWGEPEEMTLTGTAVPAPGPEEVLIRNRAAGINFFDLLQVRGGYQYKPPFPFTPGAEVCGVVAAVGERVRTCTPGDRVVAFVTSGGFAEYAVAPAARVFPAPAGMSDAEAAGFPVIYHTGWYVLDRRAQLKAGETLLVNAGASGVGMAAIQIGKQMGARVLATAGGAAKCEFARQCGAEAAFDYTDATWPDQVKAVAPRGVNVLYDPVGGDAFDAATKCIAPEGRAMVVGFASGKISSIAANRILIKNFAVIGAVWGAYALPNPEYLRETQEQLARLNLKPVITREYTLEQLPAALRDVDQRKIIGKAVITL